MYYNVLNVEYIMRQLYDCNEANDDKNVFVRKLKSGWPASPKIFITFHAPLI